MSDSDIENKAETLMGQGFEYLDEGDTEAAIKVANELNEMRYSGGFEIEALAHQQDGEDAKAIEVLEGGVKKSPNVWMLWQLLGNLYSDSEVYEKAIKAYEDAEGCDGAEIPSIYLNRSICLSRMDKNQESLEIVEQALPIVTDDDKKAFYRLVCQKMLQLARLDRTEDAVEYANSVLDDVEESDEPEWIASVLSELGNVLWIGKKDTEGALAYAWEAIEVYKDDYTAKYLIREVEREVSENGKYYRILVEGLWHEPVEEVDYIPAFFKSYDVIADSPEEALQFIKRFEPEELRDNLKIEDCDFLEDRPEEPKGVYKAYDGYDMFDPDAEDDEDE